MHQLSAPTQVQQERPVAPAAASQTPQQNLTRHQPQVERQERQAEHRHQEPPGLQYKSPDAVSFTPLQDGGSFTSGPHQLASMDMMGSASGFGMLSPFSALNLSVTGNGLCYGLPCGQMHLLLPRAVVQGKLVPGGQLSGIAQACNIQIDLDTSPNVQADQLRMVLSGTLVGNSLAALMLQHHIMFAEAG